MADVEIRARKIEMVAIEDVRPNNRNRNKHPEAQIERLMKVIQDQGFRQPLIVSNRSGLLVAGHGRLLAAKRLGMAHVPVVFQDFTDEDMEFRAMVSDNAVAAWAELDLAGINADLTEMGPFDIDLLGIESFIVDTVSFEPGTEDDQGKLDEKSPLVTQCPNCGECFDAHKNKPQN